jgi:excisionase family DNA binding protein
MPGTEKEIAVGISEAARRIGVSVRTIATLIAENDLPSCKIGRRRIVPVAALEAFVSRRFSSCTPREPRDGKGI